jgi:hypothetical protein
LGISKCSWPATHFPVKFGPVYGLRIRLISHTQTSLQYCPARAGNNVRSTVGLGSTSTGRGKLVARKLVAATWTRDNWTHATIGRDENWTRENNYKVEYSLRDASVESSIPTQGEKKGYILSRDSEVTLSLSIELVIMPLIDL